MTTNELTLERVFSAPDLSSAPPQRVRFSPDGRCVTFLKPSSVDHQTLDLWRHDRATGTTERLIEASDLIEQGRVLSDAEKALRERRRISHGGITDYDWSPDSTALLFPLQGNLFLYHLADGRVERLTHSDTHETHVSFAPDGRHLAFAREQNLWVMALDGENRARQLTTHGGGTMTVGVPEFIAQEEMHRFDGYWWSPDSRHIACFTVDESTVDVSVRYEIDADDFNVFEQRYPFTGTSNAHVTTQLVEVATGAMTDLPFVGDSSAYLARLAWRPDSSGLAVQTQSRDQRTLDLTEYRLHDATTIELLSETGDPWINLHDDLRFLNDGGWLWTSERDGNRHLYRYAGPHAEPTQLTHGAWNVTGLLAVDEARGTAWFSGLRDSQLEQHVYAIHLAGGSPERLTAPGAWHDASVKISGGSDQEAQRGGILDTWSDAETPPQVGLLDLSGAEAGTLHANHADTSGHSLAGYGLPGTTRFGELQADDGQTLHWRALRPDGDGPHPAIVVVYGGPGVQRVTRSWQPPWTRYFLQRGYALFQLDNRGSGNRGMTFEAPIHRRLGECEVRDQVLGTEWLAAQDWVDADRIGVFGHSYGGYMTLLMMSRAPELYRAGVSVAPVTDWRLYDTHYTERYMGDPADNAEGYAASNVFSGLDTLSGALLVMHGMADDNVLFTHSTKLFKALQDRNKPFEIMTYPGSKHSLAERSVSIHRYGVIERFFARTLS